LRVIGRGSAHRGHTVPNIPMPRLCETFRTKYMLTISAGTLISNIQVDRSIGLPASAWRSPNSAAGKPCHSGTGKSWGWTSLGGGPESFLNRSDASIGRTNGRYGQPLFRTLSRAHAIGICFGASCPSSGICRNPVCLQWAAVMPTAGIASDRWLFASVRVRIGCVARLFDPEGSSDAGFACSCRHRSPVATEVMLERELKSTNRREDCHVA
jgi:hypothetical protein